MKTNRILTVAVLAAAVTLTPSLFAGECSASKTASAATCTAGKDLVSVASGADNFKTLDRLLKPKNLSRAKPQSSPREANSGFMDENSISLALRLCVLARDGF